MKRLLFLLTTALVAIGVPSAAGAQDDDPNTWSIEVGGVLVGSPGDVVVVFDEPIPENLAGATCTASGGTANNSSVYPGNALIIEGETRSVRLPDVEETPGQTVTGTEEVVLGSQNIKISIELGPEGQTSGGIDLTFDCTPAVAAPAPTVAAQATTTTTVAPPVGGVDTGAGGTANQGTESSSTLLIAALVIALVAIGAATISARD